MKMTDLLGTTLAAWRERWYYPRLAAMLSIGGRYSTAELASAVLEGLAEPVSDPVVAIRRLIDDGEFRAARDLLDSSSIVEILKQSERQQLLSEIRQAERALSADLGRRSHELAERARRAGVASELPSALDEAVLDRRADAMTLLHSWQEKVAQAEQSRAHVLRSRLHELDPGDAPEWVAAVEGCVDAREFPAAEEILDRGPRGFETIGPAAAVRWDHTWAWSDTSLQEVLEWYNEPSRAVAAFNRRWRPSVEDRPAAEVVAALGAVCNQLDESTVRRFAEAVDRLLDVEHVGREIEAEGEGFRTELAGLRDLRLPEKMLPRRMSLWLGPPGSAPSTGRPAIWFHLEPRNVQPPPGISIVGPATLFELIAPESARPRSAPTRRLHLLRTVCRQLELADLIGVGTRLDLGEPSQLRNGLWWLFDLLGVTVDGVVLDTLMYDTAGHPIALRGALDYLVGNTPGRIRRITVSDVARWRTDPSATAQLCVHVRAGLDDSCEVALAVALLLCRDAPKATFTAEDLMDLLQEVADGIPEVRSGRSQFETFFNPSAALRVLVAHGLVISTGFDSYQFCGPGLVTLLTTSIDWMGVAKGALSRISERFETVLQSIQSDLSRQAILHGIKNDLGALLIQLDDIGRSVERLPSDLREMWTLLSATLGRLKEANQITEEQIYERLEPEQIDLARLLEELVLTENRYQRIAEISLVTPSKALFINASYFLVHTALRKLLTNAVQAIRAEPATREGQVHVQLRRQGSGSSGGPEHAVIDILDSGRGFSEEDRMKFERGETFTNRQGGEGHGLRYARAHLDYCGGSLVLLPAGGSLGGAHFQVRLPLIENPQLSP